MGEITNRTKRLVAELTVLVCIVCVWVVKSETMFKPAFSNRSSKQTPTMLMPTVFLPAITWIPAPMTKLSRPYDKL